LLGEGACVAFDGVLQARAKGRTRDTREEASTV
jgi:hypothetical protein